MTFPSPTLAISELHRHLRPAVSSSLPPFFTKVFTSRTHRPLKRVSSMRPEKEIKVYPDPDARGGWEAYPGKNRPSMMRHNTRGSPDNKFGKIY
eukprot:9422815-Pyramimonas_sp.AAC.2